MQRRQVAETAIRTNLLRDFYVTLGEGDASTGWVVRLYLNPLAPWIWLGAAFCALGGFCRSATAACASARPRVVPLRRRREWCRDRGPLNPLPQGEGKTGASATPPPLAGGGWGRGRS